MCDEEKVMGRESEWKDWTFFVWHNFLCLYLFRVAASDGKEK